MFKTISRFKRSLKRKKKNIVLLVCSILVSLVLLEILCFFLLKKINAAYTDEHGKFEAPLRTAVYSFTFDNVLHPYLGYVMDRQTLSGVNRFGFFYDEPVFKRKENQVIIGICGGSVADGFYRKGTEKLEQKLIHLPYFKNKNIKFINIANGGYKQPQQLIALNYFLILGAKFDFVINIDGYNEVMSSYSNSRKHIPVYFPKSWNLYARRSMDLDDDIISYISSIKEIKKKGRYWNKFFSSTLISKSNIFGVTGAIIERKLLRDLHGQTVKLDKRLSESRRNFQVVGPDDQYENNKEIHQKNIEIWRECSIQMSKLCNANNIQYYHFIQPNQYFEDSKPLNEEEQKIAFDQDGTQKDIVNYAYALLVKEGKQLEHSGVNFGDLTMIFSKENRTLYTDTCCHFNRLGNEIMADAIADFIIQKEKHLKK